jgi:uncharacterized protein YlxW (UPF0749 family)
MNMEKGKLTIVISVGITALILSTVLFTQFKTVDQTDITALETMRETELRQLILNAKNKYEEVETKIAEVDAKINEYRQELNNDENSLNLLENEVKEAEATLGYSEVHGPGIVVSLSDSDIYNIESYEILKLINELNAAGAEAISVNDERVISSTDVALINNQIILVNSAKISGPYTIKAIGNGEAMEKELTIKGGYVDEVKAFQKNVSYELQDNIVIPAYDGEKIEFKYAKNVESIEE